MKPVTGTNETAKARHHQQFLSGKRIAIPLLTHKVPIPSEGRVPRVPNIPNNPQSEISNPQSKTSVSFREFLLRHARVPLRDTRSGAYGPFTFEGRAPLDFIVTLIDKILANCLHGETVEIDMVGRESSRAGDQGKITFLPGTLKGCTLTVGGGAQFGKTVLILNFQAFATFIEFINFGYYTPDQELLAKIVDTKFRPDVIDQQPWMAEMVQFSRAENASGRAVNRKNSYQVSSAGRKSFGHFCGMQKPPTTISLDAAALDEVDDIPAQNMGYVDGRMTGSRLQLKFEIGTQRIAGAGQNARLKAGTFHVMMYECPTCHQSWNLEEEFPRCIRIRQAHVGQTFESASSRGLQTPCSSPTDPSNTSAPSDPSLESLSSLPSLSHTSPNSYSSHPAHVDPLETRDNLSPIDTSTKRLPSPGGEGQDEGELPSREAANIVPNQQSEISNQQSKIDPILTAEMAPSRSATYYTACPNCGTELDRDSGRYIAKNPHRLAAAHFSIRVSQLNISAISLNEIVAAWYTAMADPSGAALAAFHCDRLGMPNAGAAQPITQTILDNCRTLGLTENAEIPHPYNMTFGPSNVGQTFESASSRGLPTPCPSQTNPPDTSDASDPKMVGRESLPSIIDRAGDTGILQSHTSHPPRVNPQETSSNLQPIASLSSLPSLTANPSDMTREQLIQACLEAEATLKTLEMREAQKSVITNSAADHRPSSASPRFSPRYAGLDTGPRCWLWVDEWRSPATTACVWAELIASGIAPARIPQLMRDLNIACLFIDAGGEPDLTKRLVLTLNGLDHYTPPNKPRTEILQMRLTNIGNGGQGNNCHGQGLAWDGEKARWTGLRAAAVLFVSGEAKGIEQTIGFTQDGKIYPLIKCNRRESIQTAVNDFLTPENGVYEMVHQSAISNPKSAIRNLPRARLPRTYIASGVSQSLLDSHLLNLRQERDPITGEADWIDGVENHLGLAKVYARLAATLANVTRPRPPVAFASVKTPWSDAGVSNLLGVESHSRPYLGL